MSTAATSAVLPGTGDAHAAIPLNTGFAGGVRLLGHELVTVKLRREV